MFSFSPGTVCVVQAGVFCMHSAAGSMWCRCVAVWSVHGSMVAVSGIKWQSGAASKQCGAAHKLEHNAKDM